MGLSALSPAPFTYDLVQRAVLNFQRAVLLGRQKPPAVDLVSTMHAAYTICRRIVAASQMQQIPSDLLLVHIPVSGQGMTCLPPHAPEH